jgi:rod shape-determining protein MreC
VIPIAQVIGQGITYPVRLVEKAAKSVRKSRLIAKENEEIIKELEYMQKIMIENDILKKENDLLRNKLNIAENIEYRTVVSGIIHDNSFMGKQNFIIKNPNNEIVSGNVVISNKGFLLGLITDVAGSFARIQSVRDSNSNIPVKIAGTDVFGFLQGIGNNNPKIRFLSDGDFVPQNGMFLITSGVNGNIPDNIPVGKIIDVKNDEIIIELGGDIKKQESVIILLFDNNNEY